MMSEDNANGLKITKKKIVALETTADFFKCIELWLYLMTSKYSVLSHLKMPDPKICAT